MSLTSWLAAFLLVPGCALAAPKLRLTHTAVQASALTGGNALPQTLVAFPDGVGSLRLTATVDPRSDWLSASVGTAGSCLAALLARPGNDCTPITFSFQTNRLERGTYAGSVTISDPDAIDAPQVIAVVLQIGSLGVARVDAVVNPGQTPQFLIDSTACQRGSTCTVWRANPADGGDWMAIVVHGQGSFTFVGPVYLRLTPPDGVKRGTYTGSVDITGVLDSRRIPVTMRVTPGPIAVPSVDSIKVRVAQGGPTVSQPEIPPLQVFNTGLGRLLLTGVSGVGRGISASLRHNQVLVFVDPGRLSPGAYEGTVRIGCNAANCPLRVPVQFDVVSEGPPLISFHGMPTPLFGYYATGPTLSATPGGLLAIDGEQFADGPPQSVGRFPLPFTLGGSQVLLNGKPTGLIDLSFGQALLQVPSSTPIGQAEIQVVRDGNPGNRLTVNIAQFAPVIVAVRDASGNVIDAAHPVSAGATVTIEATGLGATAPVVSDGMPAPSQPLAVPLVLPQLVTGGVAYITPSPRAAHLIPGRVGIFAMTFQVPPGTPSGNLILLLSSAGVRSKEVAITVQ